MHHPTATKLSPSKKLSENEPIPAFIKFIVIAQMKNGFSQIGSECSAKNTYKNNAGMFSKST